MSGLTGYLTSSGLDLSYVFLKGTNTTNSGYKLKGGQDLSTTFLKNANNIFATNTGYTTLNGDLSTLYEPKINVSTNMLSASNLTISPSPTQTLKYYIYDLSHIYIAGTFTSVNGVACTNIAMWNGSVWTAIANNTFTSINYIYVFDPLHIYCGVGILTGSGRGVSMWNGSSWSAVAVFSTFNYINTIIAIDPSHVYIGGYFGLINGIANTGGLAMWNGSAWSSFGVIDYANVAVVCITIYDLNNIFIGVTYGGSYGLTTSISKWNGSAWLNFASTIFNTRAGSINCITIVDLSNIYIGGTFDKIGGVTANGFAYWNGSVFSPVASVAAGNSVSTINFFDSGHMLIIGSFTYFNGLPITNFAIRYGSVWSNGGSSFTVGDISLPIYGTISPLNLICKQTTVKTFTTAF